jgi:magnesium transporter
MARERTIGETIEEFRKVTFPLESVGYIYVTDREGRLAGILTLRHLVTCDRDTPLGKLMNPHPISVGPEEDADAVEEIFKKYKFLALPVVDQDRRIRGIITLKDIMQKHF